MTSVNLGKKSEGRRNTDDTYIDVAMARWAFLAAAVHILAAQNFFYQFLYIPPAMPLFELQLLGFVSLQISVLQFSNFGC